MVTVDPVALAAHPTVAALGAAFAAEGVALFLVGGCVRDAARGETPKDLDFTTPAGVDDIRRIASQAGSTFELGTEFGTVGVVVDGDVVEITQHRAESYDPASRKPDVVAVDDIVVDLARRDFTINAMAVRVDGDPVLVDPFDGLADLAAGLLRCPGDPSTIFSEDPLRIVRLVRFAARLNFAIDDATLAGARARRDRLSVVSVERVTAELDKIVAAGPVPVAMAAGVAAKLGVAKRLFGSADVSALPTLVTSAGVESPLECLAAIAVAVGTDELFAQHRFTNATMRDVRAVVSVVDDLVAMAGDDRVSFADLRARIRTHGNTICRAAAMIGAAAGAGVPAGQLLAELAQRPNLATTPLPVNGSDVIAAGIKPGPEIGYVLASLERGFCTNPEFDRDDMLAMLHLFAEQYMRS